MSNATMTAEANTTDPLHTTTNAMSLAVQAARDGAADARTRVAEAMPAIGLFLSRFTYTTCYTLSYGFVFPTMLIVRAIPKENCIVHGLVDGGRAAREAVYRMGHAGSDSSLTGTEPEGMQELHSS